MASVPAPSAPARSRSGAAGSGLSARWHGIPVWLLAAGGGGGGFLLYRWWKNRSSSSSTTAATTPTASANPASSDNSGTGTGFTGTGSGGGGEGAANNALLQQIEGQLASLSPGTGTTGTTGTSTTTGTGTGTGTTGTTSPARPGVAAVSQVAPGKILTGSSVAPVGTPGTFDLPKGNVAFQPTAAVKNGNQVAYGIGNPTQAKAITSAGGTVETGKQLAAKGWKGVTPGASYLIR